MIEQKDLTGDRLAAEIRGLVDDGARRSAVSEAARTFARPDAARTIVARALALASGQRAGTTC